MSKCEGCKNCTCGKKDNHKIYTKEGLLLFMTNRTDVAQSVVKELGEDYVLESRMDGGYDSHVLGID